jgi:hypothetical protein
MAGIMRASGAMVGGREEGVPPDAVVVDVDRGQEVAFVGEQVAHTQAHKSMYNLEIGGRP